MKNTYLLSRLGAMASLLFWLFFSSLEAIADPEIQPFVANYRAYYFGAAINATRELKKRDDNIMALSFRTESFFVNIDESSTLTWQPTMPSSLMPLDYQYRRTGIGKNRRTQLTFDWQAQQVIDLQTKIQLPIPVKTPVFDKLSYQLQLQYDLINGSNKFDYLVVDGQKLKDYRFRIVGEELLKTKLGKLATTKVERVRDNNKRATSIWFAKNWNYLMVQLEQREKDSKQYRIELVSAKVNSADAYGE